jgi:hypothetical protein
VPARATSLLNEFWVLLAESAGGDALEAVDQLGEGDLRREVHEQVDVVVLAVELHPFACEVGADDPHDFFRVPAQELGYGSGGSCWRRRRGWHQAGVWQALHELLLAELRGAGLLEFLRALCTTRTCGR